MSYLYEAATSAVERPSHSTCPGVKHSTTHPGIFSAVLSHDFRLLYSKFMFRVLLFSGNIVILSSFTYYVNRFFIFLLFFPVPGKQIPYTCEYSPITSLSALPASSFSICCSAGFVLLSALRNNGSRNFSSPWPRSARPSSARLRTSSIS